MTDIHPARDAREVTEALALRHAVFCGEQGVPLADELDGRDDEALHLVALAGARVVGTCRLLVEGEEAVLGRLAVAPAARRRGLGGALLRAAEEHARAAGARRIALHAQTAARTMYDAAGYLPRGAEFMEAGIEHVAMEKPLA